MLGKRIEPRKPRLLERKVKEQILLDGFSQGLKSDERKIPLSLVGRVVKSKSYVITDRGLNRYNDELVDCLLPTINLLIANSPRKVVRFLDAGAGEGNLNWSLEQKYPRQKQDSKTVNYHAISLQESDSNRKVKAFDLSVEKLPRNYFDVIVGVYVFPYLGDKLHALESLCNALRVGGTLTIARFGTIKINDIEFNLDDTRLIHRFTHYLELCNPHLKINFTGKGGVFIKKVELGETRMGLHFEGVELGSLSDWKSILRKFPVSHSADVFTISTYRI